MRALASTRRVDKKKLVIIVEDYPALCSAVGGMLAAAGYSVKAFTSGEELLRHGVSEAGCLLFDVVLPGMNGFELHEYLRARSNCPPVIFYTGHEDGAGICVRSH